MDEVERQGEDLDLGGGGAPEGDIFRDVPSDPTGEAEPEPVPEGKLGGEGETLEELETAAEEPEPAADEKPEPAAAEEPESAAAEPEPEPTAGKAEPEPGEKATSKKAGTAEREYVVLLQKGEDWTEPTEPIKASNGEAALRAAYAKLVPEGDESLTLVVVPKHFFNVKTVKAKVKSDRAIEIA